MNTKTKERPIIFGDDEVRAILHGRKTVFRRPVEPQPEAGTEYPYHEGEGKDCKARICPFGAPGDLLWVRECWGVSHRGDATPGGSHYDPATLYHATDDAPEGLEAEKQWEPFEWRDAGDMPRRASRITLRVTGVRVERLQEITEGHAQAEGFDAAPVHGSWCDPSRGREGHWSSRKSFADSWDSRHAAKGLGWDANPWVWVVEFERVEGGA